MLALFLRVGGGIFTKAADVGADLVGKVEAGIPEDDPRNPATIADNVGDNVGDCAGMAADLFESYEVTLVASIILGVPAFQAIFPHQPALWAAGALFPLGARAIGVLASIVGVFAVRATDKDKSAMAPINRGFLTAGILTIIGTLVFAFVYVGNPKGGSISNVGWRMFGAVVGGLVLAQIASRITEYFTSTETKPVQEIAESAATGGPATAVLSGIASGLESSVWAIIAIAGALGVRHRCSAAATSSSRSTSLRSPVWACSPRPVSSCRKTRSVRSPTTRRASPRCRVSSKAKPQRIMVSLDAVGNTTKAVTKGFAIGSAVIAAVALFSSYIETIKNQLPGLENVSGNDLFTNPLTAINVAEPEDVHRSADRWIDRVPVLVVRDPRGRSYRERRRARSAAPVRRRQDHEGREASRLRTGHRHLHRGVAA